MNEKTKNIIEWIYCIIIAIVIAVIIKTFVGTPTVVKQVSMNPVLVEGDRLILNRLPKTFKQTPKRGEIITFEAPEANSGMNKSQEDPTASFKKVDNIFSQFAYYVLEFGKDSYIKRVIALPGEHVEFKEGKVFINDKELEEPYLKEGVTTEPGRFYNFTVPEGYIFAMGDNRAQSKDCREFGCIPIEKVESVVTFRFWPLNKFGKVE